jgi:hypothetical protein
MIAAWILVCIMMFIAPAKAEPPPGADMKSALSIWYKSLKNPISGGSCCDESDCRPIEARLRDSHWEILVGTEWQVVPDERVLKRDNQDGRPIACIYGDELLCFVPPAGS